MGSTWRLEVGVGVVDIEARGDAWWCSCRQFGRPLLAWVETEGDCRTGISADGSRSLCVEPGEWV